MTETTVDSLLGSPEPEGPPRAYFDASPEDLDARIRAVREELGDRVTVLGHHYQADDVIAFADHTGDSYALARKAAALGGDSAIMFLGVHFMAETADVLTEPERPVILPDLRAGCTMADMASNAPVERAWDRIVGVVGETVTPLTYVNSTAALKHFVAIKGGATCTSSNARLLLEWAFARKQRVFFFPDQHLGRNTAVAMGVPYDEIVLWKRGRPDGGLTDDDLRRARVILWDGYCSVHQGFSADQVTFWRENRPDVKVAVHPECSHEVVLVADEVGSTARLIKLVEESPPGSAWAIGTEIHLVERLAKNHPDKFVSSLSPFQCLCSTMYRVRPPWLLWTFEGLLEGEVRNQVSVPPEIADGARLSLQRMIDVSEKG
jgi:quinolinate synthase